jgi:hypothetical protein
MHCKDESPSQSRGFRSFLKTVALDTPPILPRMIYARTKWGTDGEDARRGNSFRALRRRAVVTAAVLSSRWVMAARVGCLAIA